MQRNSYIIHVRTFFSFILGVILLACLTATAWAQGETELAAQSNITKISLPSGAVRVHAASVPASISGTLKKLVEAGGGKLVQGDAEVLAWAGGDYRKAKAASLIQQMQSNLQAGGWSYETGEKVDAINLFSVVRETPTRRAILGFFVPTDEALVVAWTEIMAAGSATGAVESNAKAEDNTRPERTEAVNAGNSPGAREIVGTWGSDGMSLLQERNTVTNSVTPSNGTRIKYVFTADGRFEHVGMLQSTVYGCTTTLFNDKRGTYEINGSNITLIPSKNFWRQQNNCAPNSTKERDYTLDHETLTWRTKTDEYGKQFICLTGKNGESCHRREQE